MTAKVDKDTCIGCGNCEMLCPDVFRLEGDGLSSVIPGASCDDAGCCREAADSCPTGSISVSEGGEQ